MIFLIFSSIEFLLWFLPIFLIVYGITPRKYRNLTLLVGSIVFYARGDVRYLPLLMISILCNYFLGLHLAKRSPKTLWRKKLLLILTLGANLAVLLWFKDWGRLCGAAAGDQLLHLPDIVLSDRCVPGRGEQGVFFFEVCYLCEHVPETDLRTDHKIW